MAKKKAARRASIKPSKTKKPVASRPAKRAANRAAKAPATNAKHAAVLFARDRAIESLAFAHQTLRNFLIDFPADQRTHLPAPTDTHMLWNVGHLACYYVFSTQLLGGQPHALPEVFEKKFQYQTTASNNAADYPGFEEVINHHDAAYDRLIKTARQLTAPQLLADVSVPGMESYAKDRLEALERAAWHEGWHTGQISTIRKALLLKAKF